MLLAAMVMAVHRLMPLDRLVFESMQFRGVVKPLLLLPYDYR
jgi:hypothetical protein